MKRKIIKTADGSSTIKIEEWDEQYHSLHGALLEANHVFIETGLHHFLKNFYEQQTRISILEIGFGTGLNAILTFLDSIVEPFNFTYTGIEAYPVSMDEIIQLNYPELLNIEESVFLDFHKCNWSEDYKLSDNFILRKEQQFFQNIEYTDAFNLIYFDAFGPRVQPDLWTEKVFDKMYKALKQQGVLVTYSAKGSVRRAMIAAGLKVEKLPGPPGKREMLRAIKV